MPSSAVGCSCWASGRGAVRSSASADLSARTKSGMFPDAMAPRSQDIYVSSSRTEPPDGAPPPRRPFRIWWEIATPAERWSAAFVVFTVATLVGILVGIAWYQHEQLSRIRRRAESVAAGGAPSSAIALALPLELDGAGHLRVDELDEVPVAESAIAAPQDLSQVTPTAIVQAAVVLRRAARAAEEGDWASALAAYQKAAEIFPESVRIREQVGLCQLRQLEYQGAAATFRWLADRRPQSAGIWNNLGVAEAGRDRFDEAQSAFERALALNPAHPFAARNLAVLAFRRGDMVRAAEALAAVLRRNPDDSEVALMCAVALVKTGRFSEALTRLEDLSVRVPSAPIWFQLAEVRARLGQNATALQALEHAVAMVDARTAIAWLNRPELDRLRADPEFQRRWSQLIQTVP